MTAVTQAVSLKDARLKRLKALQEANIALNMREFDEKKIILASTPQTVFLQINAVCNADCVFCSKGYDYPLFRLDDYLGRYGAEVTPILQKAARVILTGSGEFLGLPGAADILRYFNDKFPYADKFIATNASHLTPEVCELIAASGSRYTLQLSLHASDKETHKLMMRYELYDKTMANIRHLMELKAKHGNPTVNFMFVMTTLNAEKLPDFVRFAKDLGADRAQAGYFYVYEAQQKYLSLYFKQDLANKAIDAARRVAEEMGFPVSLPAKFGEPEPPGERRRSCSEPWHQVMLNPDGGVLPCDLYGAFHESLGEKTFAEIWNGPTYRSIRRALAAESGCLATCPRHNPLSLNDWQSHVIHRHKDEKQIVKEYKEALRKP